MRLWEWCFRRHSNSSKKRLSQSNTLAVAIVVVALGCSLKFISTSRRVTCLHGLHCKYFFRLQPNPSDASTPILPRIGDAREAASIELFPYILLTTAGIHSSVYKKGSHLNIAIPKKHNSKDTHFSEPAARWFRTPAGRIVALL